MLRLAHRGVGGLFVGGGDVKQDEPRPAAEPPGTEGGGLVRDAKQINDLLVVTGWRGASLVAPVEGVVVSVGRGLRVAVLGGGVAGLTAAMELAERGFEVTVVEPTGWGGKARSAWVPGTGRGGRLDLPSEHGFRFFPGSTGVCRTLCAGSRSTAARRGWRGICGRRRRCFPRVRVGWVSGSRMCPWLWGLGLR
ncbi:FAD-dependent oxidoreductase [Streptomyces pratensis]|nr:FAD-dependent oxidoreductase [Streptomyces pratensis]